MPTQPSSPAPAPDHDSDSNHPPLTLPDRPDLRHLKSQAADLLEAGGAASVTDAQFKIARQYGFASWPKLKTHVELLQEIGQLKEAIDTNDLERVKAMMSRNPSLHRAPLGYGKNGPLTWVAECRVPWEPPGTTRLAMARWMIENGSDVHQGGDMPLMRAALSDQRIPMMELLVQHGANVNGMCGGDYPVVCAPCETLQPLALKWLLQHGASVSAAATKYGSLLQLLICTYARNPEGKHACLEVLAEAGVSLPDTPAMAVHRGRIDLLEACLRREPTMLHRGFSEDEMWPPELGIARDDGLHGTPLSGAMLLHMAIDYRESALFHWILDHGADANGRGTIDADGFGGHTPLFHTVIWGNTDEFARTLLARGADPNARATIRKQLRDMGDPEKEKMHEFHNVTPIGFARQFQEPGWMNHAAITAIAAAGGTE